ncbi:MAG: polysaccharide biosynthesis tyrosine autokinase [Brasilonema octagenarum HA4186-MV1]|jgi:capsular exopolysaccharide synthesis family protein|uniref:Lipopolysaccharide biosynthesis protein n=1 Tax=Brasilonema octagenarum UFV-OR1 TaxID=417115 RepID=A0ABX1M652_9CYAN|nr:polysaccharide biosynthesis tyrosine autokinase [Brasilonema octagenarum]MBW4628502.1 polysaccharide biosynthesis tyrosine autokinase [Brasilonema octagenarum HA4186-MV1]NMF61497.1 lipopolysaccharide biosynthesis protein [Brasilonema octagenarum UFV-OR1]
METRGYQEEVEIQKYWLVLKRRWPIVVGVLLASIGFSSFLIFLQKPEYQASGMLLFKSDRTSSLTKVGEKIGDLESLMREGNPLETQAVILKSEPILKQVIDTLGLKDKKGNPLGPESLQIKVEPIVGTDVLKVSYTSGNPELTASVVNQVMKSYVAKNIEFNRTQVVAAGEFIKKQIPQARAELNQAAEALREFKTRYKIIELSEEASAAVQNEASIDEQINQAKAALADTSAQEEKIRSQLNLAGSQAVEITSISQIPGVQEVLSELQKVQTKLANDEARYTSDHPAITELKNKEITLNALLQQRVEQVLGPSGVKQVLGTQRNVAPGKLQIGQIKENLTSQYALIQAQRRGLESKIQELSNIQGSYKQRLSALPNLEKKQGDLERRLSIAQKNYENLVSRLQEIEVAEKQTVGNAKEIQPAQVPKKPSVSKITFLLAGGSVFVGLLLGTAAAFFVDLIDRTLKTVKEAETFFGYTLLGLIPRFESKKTSSPVNLMSDKASARIIVATSPRSVVHEAYQMLQANLKFISHRKVRTIVVTSCVPGEGKSEVSANLAAVLAQAGRRVLLVDADMRKPSQHHLWGLVNSVGLSNVIVGQDQLPQTVQTVTKELSVLTAGVQPPNPLGLLDSERMATLIETFCDRYDVIVFDTPPLAGTADAAVLGKMADGVLLVARPGVVDSASATAAKSLLGRSEARILGMIANAVNLKQESGNHFYYSNVRGEQDVVKTGMGNEQWVYK